MLERDGSSFASAADGSWAAQEPSAGPPKKALFAMMDVFSTLAAEQSAGAEQLAQQARQLTETRKRYAALHAELSGKAKRARQEALKSQQAEKTAFAAQTQLQAAMKREAQTTVYATNPRYQSFLAAATTVQKHQEAIETLLAESLAAFEMQVPYVPPHACAYWIYFCS